MWCADEATAIGRLGVGAPLAADLEPADLGPAAETARKRIPPRTRVPLTAFLRIDTPRRAIVDGTVQGKLELYAADQTSTVAVGGRDVPLELEPTAALAYQLEGAPIWDFEIAGFRFADQSAIFGDGLVMMRPDRPERIPCCPGTRHGIESGAMGRAVQRDLA